MKFLSKLGIVKSVREYKFGFITDFPQKEEVLLWLKITKM